MTTRTNAVSIGLMSPEEIAHNVMDAHYGLGTEWDEPNSWGEQGFTRAQAETDIAADDIQALIAEAILVDRAHRDATPQPGSRG